MEDQDLIRLYLARNEAAISRTEERCGSCGAYKNRAAGLYRIAISRPDGIWYNAGREAASGCIGPNGPKKFGKDRKGSITGLKKYAKREDQRKKERFP